MKYHVVIVVKTMYLGFALFTILTAAFGCGTRIGILTFSNEKKKKK